MKEESSFSADQKLICHLLGERRDSLGNHETASRTLIWIAAFLLDFAQAADLISEQRRVSAFLERKVRMRK
jgi:hypothetical protein